MDKLTAMPNPSVSIILVTWNSQNYVSRLFSALSNQTLRDFEIILVDNNSADDTLKEVAKHRSRFNFVLESLSSNHGFAFANNLGVRLSRGKWVAFLNADAFPQPNWLEKLIDAAENNTDFTFFSSRQVQANNLSLLDGAGDIYHISGLAWRKYYNYPSNLYGLQSEEVFGACAAAALYLKDEFLKAGGFDETYFSYYEDVDLSFRLRLVGGRCLYVADAVVNHIGSASTGSTSDFVYYHVHRNLVWTFFKNMPILLLLLFLPIHILTNIYLSLSVWVKEKRIIVLKAKLDAVRGLPQIWRHRRNIQKERVANLFDLYHIMSKDILIFPRLSRKH